MKLTELIKEVNVKEKYMILYAYNGRIKDEEAKYIELSLNILVRYIIILLK